MHAPSSLWLDCGVRNIGRSGQWNSKSYLAFLQPSHRALKFTAVSLMHVFWCILRWCQQLRSSCFGRPVSECFEFAPVRRAFWVPSEKLSPCFEICAAHCAITIRCCGRSNNQKDRMNHEIGAYIPYSILIPIYGIWTISIWPPYHILVYNPSMVYGHKRS